MNQDYIGRINKILVFIDKNLHTDLSLETVSKVGLYSPFHLHRLFKAITGEPLNVYIIRKRLEKAAMMLINHKEMAITEIALQVGFNSNSSFTKSFKNHYGQSPSAFRLANIEQFSKIRQLVSKNGKVNLMTEDYLCNINHLKNWIKMNAVVEIKTLPKMEVAYITQIGVDGIENAFEKMVLWAGPKGLLERKGANVVRIFHDSFKITDADKVRMSIGVTIEKAIEVGGEIGLTAIEQGKHIVGRFEIQPKDFEQSWNGIFIWMNEKGYKKAERNPFEIYYNNFNDHGEGKCIVDLCIPID